MSQTLDRSTDLNSLRERIGVGPNEELRSSYRREQFLEKFSRLMSMDPGVTLAFNESIAAVEMENDDPRILIPTKEYEQPLTDFSRKAYDLLIQETLTLHEIGHILYSDSPSLIEHRDELDEKWQASFQLLWNAIEDGCIEAQLRREFNCEDELVILNANMSDQNEFGHRSTDSRGGDDVYKYTMIQAMMVGLLNLGNYDSGHLDKIVDPDNDTHHLAVQHDQQLFVDFVPRMEEAVEDAHAEPNGPKRNEIIAEFFEDAKELLEKADVSGRKDQQARGNLAPMEGKPDDAHEGIGEARLEMGEFGGGGTDDSDSDDRVMTEPSQSGATQLQKSKEEEIRHEAESLEGGEALLDEIEKFHEMMKGASPGEENMELVIPDFKDPRPEIWRKANRLRRQLKTILRNRLNWHREQRVVRDRRRGELDVDNMVRAARGDPRVFKQYEEGREKDYSAVVLQDRSGSMSGKSTDDAEVAVGAFAMALEDLGVSTMVLDFAGGKTRLAKPFGAKSRTRKGIMTSGESSGGTPLRHATMLSKQRIRHGGGENPFIIVVTDGKASDPEGYAREVKNCNFPVLACYIREDLKWGDGVNLDKLGKEMKAFEAWTLSTQDNSLSSCLYQLASSVML